MKPKVEYGKWYECKEGTMPEDLLGYECYDYCGLEMSPNVIVKFCGTINSPIGWLEVEMVNNRRIRKKGDTRFSWFIKCTSLIWMAIPETPKLMNQAAT